MANQLIKDVVNQHYPYGFVTNIDSDTIAPGLNEDVVRLISAKKKEPAFMLEWRLQAFRPPTRRVCAAPRRGRVRSRAA